MRFLFQLLKANKLSLGFAALLVCIPLVFSGSLATYTYLYQSDIQLFTWIQWVLCYTLTIFTMGLAITPTTFIALLGGYFLSWWSLPLMIPSYLLASLLCYALSNKVDQGRILVNLRKHQKVEQFLAQATNKELELVIYSKLSPALPFALSNFLLAVMGIQLRNFVLGCFIGMLPRTIMAIWVGQQLNDILHHKTDHGQLILVFILFIISVFGLYRIFKSK